jgi:hypothetical protein
MQLSYNRLKNPSKNLWCNRQAKRDRQKLVNFVILPSQDFLFLGEHYRTDLGLIFPPEEKFQSLCQKILIFSNSPSVTARQFTELEKELGEAKLHLSKHFPCESTNLGEVVRQEE